MPMHDWTRVRSGTYHAFHYRWIATLMDRLNAGLLPAGYFAAPEQRIGGPEGDIVTLKRPAPSPAGPAVLAPPPVTTVERAESIRYARKTNRIAVHAHHLGDVVAVVEVVSPGNKDTRPALRSFARKSAALVRDGIHLLVLDPFPPGRHDRHGIHRAIWSEVTETRYEPPADRPLTLVAYQADAMPTAISNIKFDKVVVWEGGGEKAGTSTSNFLQNMARTMPPMLQVMRDIGGVEVPEFLAKLHGEANGKATA